MPLSSATAAALTIAIVFAGAASAASFGGVSAGSLAVTSPELSVGASADALAWGSNEAGQLGDGTLISRDVPVSAGERSDVTAVSAGSDFSMALLGNGTVMTWGADGFGELGDGTTTRSDVPVAVRGLTEVTAISAGSYQALALLGNGTVMAWGYNAFGQLGNGSEHEFSDVPVAVSGLTGVVAISAGSNYSSALLSNGTVMVWGYNEFGVFGNGTTTGSDVPVAVPGLREVKAFAAGDGTSTALLDNGTVMDWGANGQGQLGNGGFTSSYVPVAVSGMSGVTAVAEGTALLSNGAVMDWGGGNEGELGDGGSASSDVPVAVSGLGGVTAVASGLEQRLARAEQRDRYGLGREQLWTAGRRQHDPLYRAGGGARVERGDLRGAGQYHSLAAGALAPLPSVAKVEPDSGPPAGGTSVTITGTNLTGATAVRFGATSATSFAVNSQTSITAVAPAGTGTVDVTVTTAEGTSGTSEVDRFSYGPTVTAVEPSEGPATGGTSVTIAGTNFTAATAVEFGPRNATSFKVLSPTAIIAVSPASTHEQVDVRVTSPEGTSPIASGDIFTYRFPEPPSVTAVEPGRGPQAGGTRVTVTGTNFTGATEVKFGEANAISFEVESDTTISAVSPLATESGTTDVRVKNVAGTSATGAADQFDYVSPACERTTANSHPVITHVEPSSGQAAGGTVVTIWGERFFSFVVANCDIGYTFGNVMFGNTRAASFTLDSENQATAVAPPGTGTVDVTVEAVGKSPTGPADQFTYTSLPSPTVATEPPSAITYSSAMLNATVDPNGGEVTDCSFGWEISGSLEVHGAPCSPLPGAGESPVAVSASISGLSEGTTYRYWIQAGNAGGEGRGSIRNSQP